MKKVRVITDTPNNPQLFRVTAGGVLDGELCLSKNGDAFYVEDDYEIGVTVNCGPNNKISFNGKEVVSGNGIATYMVKVETDLDISVKASMGDKGEAFIEYAKAPSDKCEVKVFGGDPSNNTFCGIYAGARPIYADGRPFIVNRGDKLTIKVNAGPVNRVYKDNELLINKTSAIEYEVEIMEDTTFYRHWSVADFGNVHILQHCDCKKDPVSVRVINKVNGNAMVCRIIVGAKLISEAGDEVVCKKGSDLFVHMNGGPKNSIKLNRKEVASGCPAEYTYKVSKDTSVSTNIKITESGEAFIFD